ncbi:AI-2E family transporter [Actinomadura flavalba]|uniref:AI-2E family transporter n=1 Tax=Actinomadura flavalba TaxID=1120938 RepID=UPI000376B545|nr:AI-2E family transporter [Actinomadura flavalba]
MPDETPRRDDDDTSASASGDAPKVPSPAPAGDDDRPSGAEAAGTGDPSGETSESSPAGEPPGDSASPGVFARAGAAAGKTARRAAGGVRSAARRARETRAARQSSWEPTTPAQEVGAPSGALTRDEDGGGGAGGGVPPGDVPGAAAGGVPARMSGTVAAPPRAMPDPDAPDPAHDLEQRRLEAGVNPMFPFGRPGNPLGRAHPFVFGFTAALGVITAWLLVRAATSAKSVIVMLVVALFLAIGLNPAVERLRRVGLSRGWAVAVVFFALLLFFAGFVASLIPPLVEQATQLTENIPNYLSQLQSNQRIADWDRRYQLLDQAQKMWSDPKVQERVASTALDVTKQALSGTFQTLTVLILTLYFLSSLPQIKTFAYQLAPRSRRARVALLGDEILERIGGYVAGQSTIAFIAGVASYVFLTILDVPYALALSLIVAVTALIPLVGATIGAALVCLVVFLSGSLYEGIAAIIFYVVYQQVENYLLYPRVMKRTVDVAPAVTIVAALVGGTLLGVVGALLAIPTAAAIALIIREVVLPRQETM